LELILQKEACWNWVEKLFRAISGRYIYTIIFALGAVYYLAFTNIKLLEGSLNIYAYILMIDMFFLIAYLLSGILYFTRRFKEGVYALEMGSEDGTSYDEDFRIATQERFAASKLFYVIIVIILIIYLLFPLPQKSNFFYFSEPTIWSFVIDVMNYILTLLILFLLATLLWISLNVLWLLDELGKDYYIKLLRIDLFHKDNLGGLGPLRNLNLDLVIFLYSSIFFASLNFVTPGKLFYREIIFFAILLIFGGVLFFKGGHIVGKILNKKKERNIGSLTDLLNQLYLELYKPFTKDDLERSSENLYYLSASLYFYQIERTRTLDYGKNVYDLRSKFAFIGSAMLALAMTIIGKIIEVQVMGKIH
jgi:hypothetical protein